LCENVPSALPAFLPAANSVVILGMQFRLIVALLGFVSILPIPLAAQVSPEATSSPAATALPATTLAPGAATSAANSAPFDPAAATAAWIATVPAEKRAKSDAYFEGGYWLILWDFLLSAAISILLLHSGMSARIRDLAERWTRFKPMQVLIYSACFIVIAAVL